MYSSLGTLIAEICRFSHILAESTLITLSRAPNAIIEKVKETVFYSSTSLTTGRCYFVTVRFFLNNSDSREQMKWG